jgi:hypothetical protein
MIIRCIGCGRSIPVPPDKAMEPRLRAKCRCGATFLVAEAPRVEDGGGAKDPAVATPREFAAVVPPPTASRAAATARPAPAATPAAARPAAPSPAPKPPATPRPVAPSPAGAAPPAAAAPSPRPVSWRRCVSHPVRSHSVCPACVRGYCEACASAQTVQGAVICPACDGLCTSAARYDESQTRGQQQARSLLQELGTILAYPLRDPVGLLMLALFTGFFGLLARMALFGGFAGIILSQGVLLSYCFFAVSRVASGNLHDFTPDFRGISDFIEPLRLGVAVLLISAGPMLAVTFLGLGVALSRAETPRAPALPVAHADAQPPPSPEAEEEPEEKPEDHSTTASPHAERDDEAAPSAAAAAGAIVLFGIALLWKLIYTPAALTVAALSRGFFKTLNPLVGLDTIHKMGGVYWQTLLIYSLLVGAQWALGLALSFIPIAGGLIRAFVDSYVYLAVGCTLGLAVFKKARELGWD